MTDSLSTTVVPALQNMFETLDLLCAKAAERCAETGVEESVYLDWRIAPDMFPLRQQFRFASDIPAIALSRIAGAEIPTFEDDETSFAELQERIKKAGALVAGLDAAALDANPEADITVPMGPDNTVTVARGVFAHEWILPNMYFHTTAAYLILRGLGLDIGKREFLITIAKRFVG